jgi:hypothetical protein
MPYINRKQTYNPEPAGRKHTPTRQPYKQHSQKKTPNNTTQIEIGVFKMGSKVEEWTRYEVGDLIIRGL